MPKTYKKSIIRKKNKARSRERPRSRRRAGRVDEERARALLEIIELRQAINSISSLLVLKASEYRAYINDVSTTHGYNHKNIPIVLLRLVTQIDNVLKRITHLLRCHNDYLFLQAELEQNGYNNMVSFIDLTLTSMEEVEQRMQRYTLTKLDDYVGAQLGIEIQPVIRNRTYRMADAITRHPDSERTRAITRKTRSR